MDDPALVEACLKGKEGAWEAFLDRHGPFLNGLIRRRLSGCATADPDAVFQELWISLVERDGRRLRLADPSRPLQPYLAAIALDLCRRHLGREARLRRREASLPPLSEASPSPSPRDEAVRKETLDAIQGGMQALSARERLAVDLVILKDWSYAEAARKMGLTEANLGSILSRLRPKLRKIAETPPGPASREE